MLWTLIRIYVFIIQNGGSMDNIVNFEERVRNILGNDGKVLTDEVISSIEYAGMAEITIKNRVPNWEVLVGGNQELFEIAIVLQTALYLLPIVQEQRYKSKQTTHAKVEYADVDSKLSEVISERLCQVLLMLSDSELSPTGLFKISNEDKRYYGVGV